MLKAYLPILKAKPGEFLALENASKTRTRKILPLFEVCRIGESIRKAARFKHSKALTCAYLDETASRIAEARHGKTAMVDAFQWPAHSTTETGEHILPYIYAKLHSLGVKVIPVIGYDRWDSPQYRQAMQGLEVEGKAYYCLRLDSHAIEESDDPEYFRERVVEILDDLNLDPSNCSVLLDFGDVTATSLADLLVQATRVVQTIGSMGFKFFSTAGCSLPATIDRAVKQKNSTGKILRKEMLLWQTLRAEYPHLKWLFGDYGVRGPNTADEVISPHTNGKIRHTISQSYYIVRGHSLQIEDKGAQMYRLAKTIVDSSHYMGSDFSWGDSQILLCSQHEFKGNSTRWIAIDTNHHLTWVLAEVEEFEIKLAGLAAASGKASS